MRNVYIAPGTHIEIIGLQSFVCASGVVGNNGSIGYGGVDENGEKDPASRRRSSVWDDEEENEE